LDKNLNFGRGVEVYIFSIHNILSVAPDSNEGLKGEKNNMGFKEFKQKAMDDHTFANKFAGIDNPEMLVERAGTEGYHFTVSDVKNNTELTEAELSGISGGKSTIFAKNWFIIKD